MDQPLHAPGTDLRVQRDTFVAGLMAILGDDIGKLTPSPRARWPSLLGEVFLDARILAHEEQIRANLISEANKDEIKTIREEEGNPTTTARLSTWAVSLTVGVF